MAALGTLPPRLVLGDKSARKASQFFAKLTGSPWFDLLEVHFCFDDSKNSIVYVMPGIKPKSAEWERILSPLLEFFEDAKDPLTMAREQLKECPGRESELVAILLRRYRVANETFVSYFRSWIRRT